MPLHLIKLCVGCDTIRDLEDWVAEKARGAGRRTGHVHTTRMMPKRADELADGGSLYWVIKGQLACRQRLLGVTAVTGTDGIGRCQLALERAVVPVRPRPCRPFQGWRYLDGTDAPPDLGEAGDDVAILPEPMRRELVALGLL